MTLSFVLEMNKGLRVSTGYTHAEFENHLSCWILYRNLNVEEMQTLW